MIIVILTPPPLAWRGRSLPAEETSSSSVHDYC